MIAISSFRALDRCSTERQAQVVKAKESWELVFSEIHYFNRFEARLNSPKTKFIIGNVGEGSDERPVIADLADHAAGFDDWTTIVNSDIRISEKFVKIEPALKLNNSMCAFSKRITSESALRPDDSGLDIFCAVPEVWALVARRIPRIFTLGRIRFDTWLCSFFTHKWARYCYDFTQSRLIYHQKHEEREDQNITDPDDFYLKNPRYPHKMLRL